MKKIITNSEKETFELAKGLAEKIKGGEVFALYGDLGAGKTVFAKGLASGLGVKKTIVSPTFVLMKIYPAKNNQGIKKFCHIDAYRLSGEKDLEAIGALDYFGKKDCVCLVEWPEKIKKLLPESKKLVKIKHMGEKSREIYIFW